MTDQPPSQRRELRASHEDRDRVAEQLRIAAGDGRLSIQELDERLERALSARTAGELVELVNDLPAAAEGPPEQAAKELVRIQVSQSSTTRNGRWVLPRALEVEVTSGTVVLDLTEALITSPTLKITVTVHAGTLKILTRPGIVVDADEVTVQAGTVKVRAPKTETPAPSLLRVEVAGSVRQGTLVARPPRRGLTAWLRRRPAVRTS